MKVHLSLVFLIFLVAPQIHAFQQCGGGETLTLELNEAASKAAKWLTETLEPKQVQNDFHIDSAALHSLYLAGYNSTHSTRIIDKIQISYKYGGRLGLHVNGMIASCKKPRRRMVKLLRHCTETTRVKCGLTHSFQYLTAALALCNSGHSFGNGINTAAQRTDQIIKRHSTKAVDTFALGIITRSCINKRLCESRDDSLCKNADNKIVQQLLKKQNKLDGSFGGNGISTALAVQALLANRVPSESWQCSKAMKYLLSQQKKDGSFGGLMATIQILPVLKGATLSDHGKLYERCNRTGMDREDNKVYTQTISTTDTMTSDNTMATRDSQNVTVTLVLNVTGKFECHYDVRVKNGSTALEVLQSPDKNYTCCDDNLCDQEVSFRASYTRYGPYVEAIGRYEENKRRQLHWFMYTSDDTMATVGVDGYYPKNGTRLTFKFQTAN